jgi:hypothetical protein
MPNPKILIPQAWKTIADKHDVEDKDLYSALTSYQKLKEEEHDERLAALKVVNKHATLLRKDKEIAALSPVVKYLAELLAALPTEEREVLKAKAAAAAQQKENLALKKAEAKQEDGEDEDDGADYATKLLAAFQKLKGAKDVAYQFIICDAKPYCGLAVAKRITPKHKEELSKLTDGKRFLPIGTCHFDDGKYVFAMEHPVTGLARRIQDSIKNFTGKKLPIMVGTESEGAEDEKPAAGQAAAAASAKVPQFSPERLQKLAKAPDVWHETRKTLMKNVDLLKTAVRKQFAEEGPELVAEIEQNFHKLDGIFDTLDQKLADSLAKAHSVQDPAARHAELQNAKGILAKYIQYVKSEPMIAHIDSNPFGVQTNLKQTLSQSLTNVAQTIS